MVLPIDAIIPIYYSASVNYASTNNQAVINPSVPTQQFQWGTNIIPTITNRRWQHPDIVLLAYPGMQETIALLEQVSIKVIRYIQGIFPHVWG